MSETPTKTPVGWNWPVVWGCFVTTVVVAVFLYAMLGLPVSSEQISASDKWTYLKSASPNEIGDTLAGFAGSLAFVWLIVTVWIQSKELRAQREELCLTREEFHRMADAQNDQVKLLEAQGQIFEDEQKQRKEDRARLLLEEKLSGWRNQVHYTHELGWKLTDEEGRRSDLVFIMNNGQFELFDRSEKMEALSTSEYSRRQFAYLQESARSLIRYYESGRLKECPSVSNAVVLCRSLKSIVRLQENLSDDQVERLNNMGLESMAAILSDLIEQPIWGDLEEVIQ